MFALRILPFLLSLALQANPPAGDPPEDPPAADPPKPKASKPEGVTDEIQEWVSALVARETKAAKAQAKADASAAMEEARKQREADAQRKKQEEAGEFDKVRTGIEQERDTAKAELDAAAAELETLREYTKADIAAVEKQVKDTPSAKVLLDFHPGEEATVPQLLAWAAKAKAGLPELQKAGGAPGNRHNPKPGGPTGINEQQEVARIRSRISPL